ncbi:DUF6286 domain-containing protein [Streptomyces sp. NPDC101181]|uniref:DUF6286 domain-containing protein n=1 Tax=Streptomyces sp. NPDC101181 TaxID=3366125 RepID=UPI00381442A6
MDIIAVRLGGAPAAWRTTLVGWAAAHGPADTAVRAGGVLAASAGVWLLGCALLPGLRGRLPMASPTSQVRFALDRAAAARVVRDRLSAVPGIVRARVRVRRGRFRVLVTVGFGVPEQARAEAERVVRAGLPDLGMVRTPAVRVRIRQAARGSRRVR